jgi:hypothetical protein
MWRQDGRLSLFPARCYSYHHVFVPRDDFIYAMCQVYLGEEELSSKKTSSLTHYSMGRLRTFFGVMTVNAFNNVSPCSRIT